MESFTKKDKCVCMCKPDCCQDEKNESTQSCVCECSSETSTSCCENNSCECTCDCK